VHTNVHDDSASNGQHEHHADHNHDHHPHMPHSHAGHAGDGRRGRIRLGATMAVTATIMVAEVAGGMYSGSLALLADAGHMLTDLLSLLVAFAAMVWGARPADARRTYGYRRLEVLAALVNSVALVLVAGSIAWEAWQRLKNPASVALPVMMSVAAVGLGANLIGLWLIGHGHDNVNLRGAFLHILGDTLSSLGVIIGGAIMATTGWLWIDPLLSVALALLIVVSSSRLLKEVIDVLLEAVPRGIDTEAVYQAMHQVAGVDQVHDLHIWSITSGMAALSAHVVVTDVTRDPNVVLHTSLALLREKFHIDHATLQIERSVEPTCGCPHNTESTTLPR
jgi:cobalt-zinc-cadmium efflux system protein